jgi:hypothetical protein
LEDLYNDDNDKAADDNNKADDNSESGDNGEKANDESDHLKICDDSMPEEELTEGDDEFEESEIIEDISDGILNS